MQRLVFLCAIACLLGACSEQACDPTGQRYAKMKKEGTPFTEKDKSCVQAVIIKGFEDARARAESQIEIKPSKK